MGNKNVWKVPLMGIKPNASLDSKLKMILLLLPQGNYGFSRMTS